jgi:hypothetical protein
MFRKTKQYPWPRVFTFGCGDTIFSSLRCTLKSVIIKGVSSILDLAILCVGLPLQ